MSTEGLPRHYQLLQEKYPELINAVSDLGRAVRREGPLEEKTVELIQMAAAAALRLEGATRSHARRAIKAGASSEEVHQALIVITSTAGFPSVASAMSWIMDITSEQDPTRP